MTTEAKTKPARVSRKPKTALESVPPTEPNTTTAANEPPPFDADPKPTEPAANEPTLIADEVVDRAEISGGKSLVKLSRSEALVLALTDEAKGIDFSLVKTDPTVEQAARQFRVKTSANITAFKESCLELRRPARDFASQVIAAEGIIEAQLRAILALPDAPLKELDEARKAERERKAAEAAAAAQKISDAITAITSRPTTLVGKPAADIAQAIEVIDAIEVTEEAFGTRAGEALKAKIDTLDALRNMHAGTEAMEHQQAELAEQQAALEKTRAAQRAIDAIGSIAMRALGKTSAAIAELIAEMESVDVMADVFAGRDAEAMTARDAALTALRQMHTMTTASETMAAQQAEQQAALNRQQQDQAARQDELDRQEQVRRDEAARLEREAEQRHTAINQRLIHLTETPERMASDGAGSSAIASTITAIKDTAIDSAHFGDRVDEALSLRDRVLTELEALKSSAETIERAAEVRRQAEETERNRLAAETAEREAAELNARLRAEAIKAASTRMLNLLALWRDAEAADNSAALAEARDERDEILQGLGL